MKGFHFRCSYSSIMVHPMLFLMAVSESLDQNYLEYQITGLSIGKLWDSKHVKIANRRLWVPKRGRFPFFRQRNSNTIRCDLQYYHHLILKLFLVIFSAKSKWVRLGPQGDLAWNDPYHLPLTWWHEGGHWILKIWIRTQLLTTL